jgi:dynein heavy chain
MNIDNYKSMIHAGLNRLEELVMKINDIVENRIQKNLKQISRAVLISLPYERTVTLEEFVLMQESSVRANTNLLAMKNLEVETAVTDLFNVVSTTAIDPSIEPITRKDFEGVYNHFNSMTYQALLNCVRVSLNLVKKKVCSRLQTTAGSPQQPFFDVDVQLSVPSVRLSPSLDDIQRAINRASVAVLGSSKRMWLWNQANVPEKDRRSFFDILGQDTEVVKTVLLLTGAMFGTVNTVHSFLREFKKYDWLWKEDKDVNYKKFVQRKPTISDFEEQLKRFLALEEEILGMEPSHNIGALRLNTVNLKLQLCNESRMWKVLFSNNVHKLAKESMYSLFEYMRVITNKLNIEVQSLDTLRYVMTVLKEVREKESSIEMEVSPILDMYNMLEQYLPDGVFDHEEIEQKSTMITSWGKVVEHAESLANSLSAVQGTYKMQLVRDIREFTMDIRSLRKDFEENGPLIPGIKPALAVDKLKKYKDELVVRERKLDMYRGGEELFALRPTRFNEVAKTRKEITLIDQLYSLYVDMEASFKVWAAYLWRDIADQVSAITESVNGYDSRCKKLPKKLREWPAYDEISAKISDLQTLLPLVSELSKPSIKPRHWGEINGLLAPLGTTLPYHEESFSLAQVVNSGVVKFKEEVEEICDSADKQLQIEKKLSDLKEHWALASFEFSMWKNRDIPVLKAFGVVIEELEEAQLQLQTLLSIRHVAPFRTEVQKFLSQLSDTADTLEMWVKVQMLWTSLESVFLGGDIAKQMPLEAKKFAKINKDWEKLMGRASETKFVVQCCSNELLRTTLPALYSELEKCQKSLEGYLEQKRSKFPRYVTIC